MAIFGQNGLSAAALYLATVWAVYGQKLAGFPNKAAIQKVENLSYRKNAALKDKKGSDYKDAVKTIRERRHGEYLRRGIARTGKAGAERYKEYTEKSTFDIEQQKLGYLR